MVHSEIIQCRDSYIVFFFSRALYATDAKKKTEYSTLMKLGFFIF